MSFRKKGSQNRKKAKHRLAVVHEKVRNTRRDFLHKLSRKIVHSHSLIALEDLGTAEMAGQQYGKQINDAGWAEFADMLCYKAESAGCKVVFVDARNTSKECSGCGEMVRKDLRMRQHNCPACGLSINRDLNAALNILARATNGTMNRSIDGFFGVTGGTPGSNACGDVSLETSMKQDAAGFIPR